MKYSIVKMTTEIPKIIPPLPEGEKSFLKTWQDYWTAHDNNTRKDEREKIWNAIKEFCDPMTEDYFKKLLLGVE